MPYLAHWTTTRGLWGNNVTNLAVSFTLEGKTATINESFELAGIFIPAGFESDGISSPCWTWFRYHPFSRWCPAAFLHDYCIKKFGYAFARDKFKEGLKELGSKKVDCVLIYNAVRLRDWQRRLYEKLGLGEEIESNHTGGSSD